MCFILHIIVLYSVQIIFTDYTIQVLKFKYPPNRIIARTKVREKSVHELSFWNCKIKILLQYWMWYIPHKNLYVRMKCNYRNVQSIFVALLAPVHGVSSWLVHFLLFHTKTLYAFIVPPSPCMLHAFPISSPLLWLS